MRYGGQEGAYGGFGNYIFSPVVVSPSVTGDMTLADTSNIRWTTDTFIERGAAKTVLITGDGTGATTNAGWYLGYGQSSGYAGLWVSTVTPTGSNYSLLFASSENNYNAVGNHVFRNTGTAVATFPGSGGFNLVQNVATPAAGSTSARVMLGTTAGFGIYYGSGAPTVSAAQGSIYLRSDGSSTSTRMYVNTDGGTTWTAVTTAA